MMKSIVIITSLEIFLSCIITITRNDTKKINKRTFKIIVVILAQFFPFHKSKLILNPNIAIGRQRIIPEKRPIVSRTIIPSCNDCGNFIMRLREVNKSILEIIKPQMDINLIHKRFLLMFGIFFLIKVVI